MTSIIPGPWHPPIEHQTLKELRDSVREKEGEIARLLRCYRAAGYMKEVLESIANGKVLPEQNRRAAQASLLWVQREFPELDEMDQEGL